MSEADNTPNGTTSKFNTPKSKSGWDGKLRVNKQAVLANPQALSDPEYSDEDAPPAEQIDADEGIYMRDSIKMCGADYGRSAGGRGS